MKAFGLFVPVFVAGLACGTPTVQGDLGNPRNPVRADTFLGELEYSSRLRCIYLNSEHRLFIDPHHPRHAEPSAVAGFLPAGPPDRRRLFWLQSPR